MNTKDRILETSIDLFSRQGYSSVSIRDITGVVGIKESTLYYHFKNKEDILLTIFARFQEGYKKIFPPPAMMEDILIAMTPEAFLRKGIENYKTHIADHPEMSRISRILYIEQFSHQRAREILLQDVFGQSIGFLEVMFGKMIEAGKIRSLRPKTLAREYQYPVFAMFMEYQILKFDNKDTSELEAQLYEHAAFFIERIRV
ncbi:TetR/AcrR family transcriptional regulator [Paenibacillus mesophilus]|uniref:TetR/AcrR family transcriptional regulator n=1 Tax=Paenibacillus mesophilus TaxID=2582849 RepID=UPI00130543CF|nr:TetR/AcrR family transcriptional regulator [Paenibacillus mesophilus]